MFTIFITITASFAGGVLKPFAGSGPPATAQAAGGRRAGFPQVDNLIYR
jgi:hypothetical protein